MKRYFDLKLIIFARVNGHSCNPTLCNWPEHVHVATAVVVVAVYIIIHSK